PIAQPPNGLAPATCVSDVAPAAAPAANSRLAVAIISTPTQPSPCFATIDYRSLLCLALCEPRLFARLPGYLKACLLLPLQRGKGRKVCTSSSPTALQSSCCVSEKPVPRISGAQVRTRATKAVSAD